MTFENFETFTILAFPEIRLKCEQILENIRFICEQINVSMGVFDNYYTI